MLGVAALVVAADQVSKTLVLDHLKRPLHVFGTLWLELTFNPGTAFGLGAGATPVVVTVVVVLVVVLATLGGRASQGGRREGRAALVGFGLLIGGAVGNLADRLLRSNHGAVVDFIDAVQVGDRQLWPVFNVADAAIVVGAIVVGVAYTFGGRRRAGG